jgi:predicted RNA-binding Zn-ribbon protein involved in translation (DUF1610 family)
MTDEGQQLSLPDQTPSVQGPIECLGMTFESDQAQRAYFTDKLREKLQDPTFRQIEGFPTGADEDILALSDPPYYTACPNPFIEHFVLRHGQLYVQAKDDYHRHPFAVDVSQGKADPIYAAHSYHTKVPFKAIMGAILYYTEPGDLVLDGFAGTGMTGVAVQMCGSPPTDFKGQTELEWQAAGRPAPTWGARCAILSDLSPVASFIAANYNLPFDVVAFTREARRILRELKAELGWMYQTLHNDGHTMGQINYAVWSDVFACPNCAQEIIFLQEALDPNTQRVRDLFACPHCGVELSKTRLERLFETVLDPALGRPLRRPRRRPVLINYKVGDTTYEKAVEQADLELLQRVEALPFPSRFPTDRMMHVSDDVEVWGDKWRAGTAAFTHVHHLFLPRPTQALGALWDKTLQIEDTRMRNALLFAVEQAVWTMSVLNRYRPAGRANASKLPSWFM